MIAQARALPGGDAPNLTWIVGRVEDVALAGPVLVGARRPRASTGSTGRRWRDG